MADRSSGGEGEGARFIDPDHVYELYVHRRPEELVGYVDSFGVGADGDVRCNAIKQLAKAFLRGGARRHGDSPASFGASDQEHAAMSARLHQLWADHARKLAQECCLAVPENIVDLTNIASDTGQYSGIKLTNHAHGSDGTGSHVFRHSLILNQGSAFGIRTPPATPAILQANHNVGYYMNPFDSSSYSGTVPNSSCAETIANSSYVGRMPVSSYAGQMPNLYMALFDPSSYSGRMLTSHVYGTSCNVVNGPPAFPTMLNQPSVPNSEIPTAGPYSFRTSLDIAPTAGALPLHQPGPEQFDSQEAMQNAQGNIHPEMVRLSVASLIAPDGTQGFGGVLMRGSKGQFIRALCFPIPSKEPAIAFVAACCEATRAVQCFNPSSVLLESHLLPLLKGRNVLRRPEIQELRASLRQVRGRISVISEESNDAACQLAMRAPRIGNYVFEQIPDWLVFN